MPLFNKSKKDDNAEKANTPRRGRSTTPGRRTPSADAASAGDDTRREEPMPNQEEPEQNGERTKTPEPDTESVRSIPMREDSPDALIRDRYVRATLSDPLGNFLFPQFLDTIRLCNPNLRVDSEMMRNFCTNYTQSMREYKEEQRREVELEAQRIVHEENDKRTQRHFSNFTNQTGIKPPSSYASKSTLSNDQKLKLANGTFPLKHCFKGDGKPPYITDYLSEMNTAQELCNLSRSEFETFMLRTTTGEAYTTIQQSFNLGLSIESVYNSLLLQYDILISPQEAQAKLIAFKGTKAMSFPKLVSTIQNLASRAAVHYTDKKERQNVFNITAVEALKRSLPTNSRNIASENHHNLTHDLGRSPTYHELTASMYPRTEDLDLDLQQNGVSASYNGDLSLHKKTNNTNYSHDRDTRMNRDKQPAKVAATSSYYKRPTVREVTAKPAYPKTYNRENRDNRDRQPQKNTKQDYHISYGTSNKRYCGACGQNSHKISDGCRLLCDDQGRQYQTALTSGYCPSCHKKYGKDLYHAQHLCPGRPAMMELYHSGKVRPGGVFRQAYEEWVEAKANGQSKERGRTSRVNAITVRMDPNDPKILAVDSSAAIMDENRKMYLNCSGCMSNGNYDVYMTALFDSAADRNIMSTSYFGMLFGVQQNEVKNHLEKSDMVLVSYSGHKIPVAGEITLMIRLTQFSGIYRPVPFMIVPEEHKNVTPMIIGMNGIRDLQLGLTFVADNHPPAPYLYSMFHPGRVLDSLFCSDYELQLCTGTIDKIDSNETQTIEMNINHFFNLAPGTKVILSDDHIANDRNGGIKIQPGQTQLTVNNRGQLSGRAMITNVTEHAITNTVITGYLEPSNQFVVKEITTDFDFTQSFLHNVSVTTELDEIVQALEQHAEKAKTPAVNQISLDTRNNSVQLL